MKFDLSELLTVSEFAKEVDRSIDTVRRWHSERKLMPAVLDTRGVKTTRYYTKKQVLEIKKRLQRGGV